MNITTTALFKNNHSISNLAKLNSFEKNQISSTVKSSSQTLESNDESTLKTIATRYNLRSISLNDKQSLGSELLENGTISPFEMAVLTVADEIPIDGCNIDPQQEINLIGRFEYLSEYGSSFNSQDGNDVFKSLLSVLTHLEDLKSTVAVDLFV